MIAGSLFFIYQQFFYENKNINYEEAGSDKKEFIRIGYFHGGRTHLFYRAYINNYFHDNDVEVKLLTKILHKDGLFEVSSNHNENVEKIANDMYFGRMTGTEIVDEIEKGELDGGLIGEASFLAAIDKNSPIIAVATLGHDTKDEPGHAFVLRKGLVVDDPKNDLKGKVFTSRRSGPVDAVLTREFIENEGLNLNDVNIIDNMPDDRLYESLANGEVDGGYYHLHWVKKFINNDIGYVYRKLDWINPEASLALIVFHRDFLKEHKRDVQKIVNAYVKRIEFEKGLSEDEKRVPKEFGLQMINEDVDGMNIPQYDLPPVLRKDLLEEMQNLLLKYEEIDKGVDIEDYLDYSFVKEAMRNLKGDN